MILLLSARTLKDLMYAGVGKALKEMDETVQRLLQAVHRLVVWRDFVRKMLAVLYASVTVVTKATGTIAQILTNV